MIKRILFDSILPQLREASFYFSLRDVKRVLNASQYSLTDGTLREYMNTATAQGIIYDAGRGWYSRLDKTIVLDPKPVLPLLNALKNQFPFLSFYVWSTQQLNPYMHHLLGKFVSFVFLEPEGMTTVNEFLRDAGWELYMNPNSSAAKRFIVRERTVVLRTISRSFDSATEPTVETVLIDLLIETSRLPLMDRAEFQDMASTLAMSGRLNIASLVHRLGDHKKQLSHLFGTRKPIISDFSQSSEMMG